MPYFRILVLGLHILAAIIWIGGLFYEAAVLLPVLRKSITNPVARAQLLLRNLSRFQPLRWEAIAVVLLTGIFNIINVGLIHNFSFSRPYVGILLIKLALVILVIGIQLQHQLRYIPALQTVSQEHAETAKNVVNNLEKKLLTTAWLSLVAALWIIFLALTLRFI